MYSFMNSSFGQADRLDGVRRQEAVLHAEERRLAGLGGAASDQAEIAGFLGIAGEQHAPADIGDRHHVVVAGMDIEALAGQGAAPMFMTTGRRLPEMV